jgi:L-ascorbate metabolism protein UlaG (beta-lactamase superfamily)
MKRERSRILLAVVLGVLLIAAAGITQSRDNTFVEKTKDGNLTIQALGHASVRLEFKGKQYYVDPAPAARGVDWKTLPKADFIFITHQHGDHLNAMTVNTLKKDGTAIYADDSSIKQAGFGTALNHGEKKKIGDATTEAIPAYNVTPDRLRFHPKERKDNGYVLTFGGKRIYLAGDTEGTDEMKALKNIDMAFLPCNLPFTMDTAQCAAAARAFKPKVLVPYHQGQSKPEEVKEALKDVKEIEVRVLALP